MPRRRQAREFDLSAEISVTSLVDVAFVLLLIFLITAPVMQGGVEVQIPKAQTESIAAPEGVVVTVASDGRIFIGDAEAPWAEFRAALADAVAAKQADNIYLRADDAVPYGRVVRVLGAMKAMDIAGVGLVAEPEAVEAGG